MPVERRLMKAVGELRAAARLERAAARRRRARPKSRRLGPLPVREKEVARAITIRQPWAELIIRGRKDVENRSWRTRHRGPLLIHAGVGADTEYFEEFDVSDDVVRGAIIGVVELVECTKKVSSDWHGRGNWGWYLARPHRFKKPIPMKGRLGLFEVPGTILSQLPKALRKGAKKRSGAPQKRRAGARANH